MSSEINYQSAEIQRLILPKGLHIATNASPSLLPLAGSLAYEVANPTEMYIGNGTAWSAVSKSNGVNAFSYGALINLAGAGGNPNLPACSLVLHKTTVATGGPTTMIQVVIMIDQSITTVATGDWSSLVGDIPASFRPAQTAYFSGAVGTASSIIPNVFRIQDDGQIVINFAGTPGANTRFTTYSCTYYQAA